jgi:ADP-ribosylglycohydrolase
VLGALSGDVIGSAYEHDGPKSKRFEMFHPFARPTDDSVMTVAVSQALFTGEGYASGMRRVGNEYPTAGYGSRFYRWLRDPSRGPYQSWSNGSAMRSSPVGWRFDTEAEVLAQAEAAAVVTHDHPEGIRGAQAVALAVFLARTGHTKAEIARSVAAITGYNLTRKLASIRETYSFQIRCETSVPEALIAFLESRNFNDAVRGAVSLGGDADTQACIAGAVAEAFYGGVPDETAKFVLSRMHPWLLELSLPFLEAYGLPTSASQLRARWTTVTAALQDRLSFSVRRIPNLSDALDLSFAGPTLSRGEENITAALGAVIGAGWTRLHFDLSRVTILTGSDRQVLEFVYKSCRVRSGFLAVTGTTEAGPGWEVYADAEAAITALRRCREMS